MPYTLKLTDGTTLLTLSDQQVDNVTTSLTLIGKNVNSYGTAWNDNFIRLMENFSNTTQPTNPLVGQLWFSRLDQRIYCYNDSDQFAPVGYPTVSLTQPLFPVTGDLWIDTTNNQLNFYNGNNFVIAGPAYTSSQGTSGIVVETTTDSTNTNRTIVDLYSNGILIGVISSSTFVPSVGSFLTTVSNISLVGRGITVPPGTKFYGTATFADNISNPFSANLLVTNTTTIQSLIGPLNIYNDSGLNLGINQDLQLHVTGTNRVVTMSLGTIRDFDFTVLSSTGTSVSCLHYSSSTGYLGIFNSNPAANVDIGGNVIVRGNLNVIGTSTSVSVVNLQVTSTNITLGYTTGTSTDLIANGGGIILQGTTNKTFLWLSSQTSWVSSENISISSGKAYEINGVSVLNSSSLGSSITSAPGLTTIGSLTSATIGQIQITNATVGTTNSVPLVVGSGLATVVDFNGKKLQNAYTPTSLDTSTVVATKGYVDTSVKGVLGNYALSMDVTNHATGTEDTNLNTFVIGNLQMMLPPNDATYGVTTNSRARVLVTRTGMSTSTFATINRAIKQYIVSTGTWTSYIYTGSSNTFYTDGTW